MPIGNINHAWTPTDESGEASDTRQIVKVALLAFSTAPAARVIKDMTSFDIIDGVIHSRNQRLKSTENAHIEAFRSKNRGCEVTVMRHVY